MDFSDRDVVVTGGTGFLGTAVVGLLLGAGARCFVPNFCLEELERFAHRSHPKLNVIENVDLTYQGAVDLFYDDLPSLWASVHLAGGFAMAPIEKTGTGDFHAMMSMNVLTCYLCCRASVAKIRKSPGVGGRLVNVAARPAVEPRSGGGMVLYTTAKAAVAALTQALGEELAAEDILVTAVAPSILDTPANRSAMPQADYAQWPKVDDVARTIAFLASPDNRTTRSAVVPVYGRV
ncbi:MAG: SDR family NAD(P)-dependent oxidoreductase [Alphaproteobacteria bacterium]|nr:SDR family NAD(P)-dependent oxidoreductase [Alphaproteobacteria bacterium]